MKDLFVVVAIAFLAGLAVSAQPRGSVAQELMQLEQAAEEATVKKDRAALERLYADDYSYTHSNGVVLDKAQEIAQNMSADLKWTSATLTDTKVRVFGDAAILTTVETLQGSAKGYVSGARRVTDVWVKRNSRWQEVGGHSTVIGKDTSSTAAQSAAKTLQPKTLATNTADDRAVLQADQAFARADVANDDAKARALQTSDYSFVSRTGAIPAAGDPPATPNKSMVVAYDRIRTYGTLAVVQGSLLWTDAKGFSPGVLRFTRVWVKDGGTWKIAAEQRTPIAATRPLT